MRTRIHAVLVVASVFALSNCAMLNKARSGDLSGAAQAGVGDAAAAGAKIKGAVDRAMVECKPLETRVIAWPEERAIGGAMAINNAMKGKGLFVDVSEKDPAKLKKQVDDAKGKRDVVVLTPSEKNDLNAYVQLVGEHLVVYSSRPTIPWTFAVVDDPSMNAFSAPGGYVFLTTGLLASMENEAQLAGALAHEIGHITAKHALESYQGAKVIACKVAIAGMNLVDEGASNIPGAQEYVDNAKFGKTMRAFASTDGADMDNDPKVDKDFMVWFTNRVIDGRDVFGNSKRAEYDADRIAQELMGAAGYDSKELEKLLAKDSGGGWFHNHPSADSRIEALQKLRSEGAFGSEGGKAPPLPANVKWPAKPAS